ncbi:hypothetical protein LTS08_004892 [Lithohypha guttulata]|nr:hypothetical protein LTS08_004892 [Lithohypha guttulata]
MTPGGSAQSKRPLQLDRIHGPSSWRSGSIDAESSINSQYYRMFTNKLLYENAPERERRRHGSPKRNSYTDERDFGTDKLSAPCMPGEYIPDTPVHDESVTSRTGGVRYTPFSYPLSESRACRAPDPVPYPDVEVYADLYESGSQAEDILAYSGPRHVNYALDKNVVYDVAPRQNSGLHRLTQHTPRASDVVSRFPQLYGRRNKSNLFPPYDHYDGAVYGRPTSTLHVTNPTGQCRQDNVSPLYEDAGEFDRPAAITALKRTTEHGPGM